MKTRAQRQRDQAAGAPTSPAHELPPTRPRRVAKSRNSPARTAIRNAARKAIERDSLSDSTGTNSSPRDETASNAQGSEVAGSYTVRGEVDGQTGNHPHSESHQSSETPTLRPLLGAVPHTTAAQQSQHDGAVNPNQVASPFSSPHSSTSSPLSSAPSEISTPSQIAEVDSPTAKPAVSEAPSHRSQPAFAARPPVTPFYTGNTLRLGQSPVSISDCSWNTTPTPSGRSPDADPDVEDDRSPMTRAWEATPVAKLTAGQERMLRSYGKMFPKEPYAILHFWESPTLQDMESARPVSVPTVLMAMPKSCIRDLMNDLAAKYPGLVIQRPATDVAGQTDGSTTAAKRKSPFENPRPARRVRFDDEETPSNRRIIGYLSPPLYDAKGKLKLGQPPVPIFADSSDDEETDKESDRGSEDSIDLCMSGALQPASEPDQQQHEQQQQQQQAMASYQVTETPSRWGIGKILDSASKYVPGLGRRARPTATPISLNFTPQNTQPEQHPSIEPRLNTQPFVASTSETPATAIPSRRSRHTSKTQPETNKVAKPKRKTARDSKQMSRRNQRIQEEINADEEKARNSQAERDFIADQIRILDEEQARKARADKKSESKSKRKRSPSPDVIPHPPGCSYGFDPKYFVVSDSDSDGAESPSPTSDRPSKSRRIDSPPSPDPLIGSKENAQPYTGAIFGSGTPTYHGGNAFREYITEKTSAEKAAALKQSAAATPKSKELRTEDGTLITNLSGHFTVPDDSDDESDKSELSPSPSAGKAEAASKDASTSKHPTPASSPMTVNTPLKSKAQTWTQPPPPPPNPSHASLPMSASTDSESLKAARAKALQHAPRKPSGLRESSRMTSSPVAPSDIDAVQTQKGFTIMQPPVGNQEAVPSASDEAIAQIENEVANSPTPPLHEVLGVLTEKAPNGQTKSSTKFSQSSEKIFAAEPASTPLEAPKTPSKAALFSADDPPKSPQGYTLQNGLHISKSAVQAVDAQYTPEVKAHFEEVVEWDFTGWKRLHPELVASPDSEDYSEEDLEREAEEHGNDFFEWAKHH